MQQSAEYMRNWRRKNAEHYRLYKRTRYQKLKDKINAQRRASSPEVKARNACRQRLYYQENRAVLLERQKNVCKEKRDAWNLKTRQKRLTDPVWRDKRRAEGKRFREKHKDKVLERNRNYYEKNKDSFIESVHLYYRENRAKIIVQKKEYRRRNKALYKNIAMNKKARKALAIGSHTFEGWMEKVKYYGWKCFYCKVLLTEETLSQDHAVPLSRNGTNFLSNLLPACVPCNSRKKDKTVSEFLRKRAA